MPTVTNEIIEAAIDGLEAKKLRIEAQLIELRHLLNGKTVSAEPKNGSESSHPKTQVKRKLSPEAIERMRQGQQRRWAKARGESEPAAKTAPVAQSAPIKKPKRKLSAAGRKAIAEAQKKRWAAKKAAA